MRKALQQHGIQAQDIHDILLGILFGVICELAAFFIILAGSM